MSFEDGRPGELEFEVPNRQRIGVYANAAKISYSEFEFTLDWAVLDQAEEPRAIVCSRVRIPVTMIFDVLQGINRVMTSYEQRYGEIRRRDE